MGGSLIGNSIGSAIGAFPSLRAAFGTFRSRAAMYPPKLNNLILTARTNDFNISPDGTISDNYTWPSDTDLLGYKLDIVRQIADDNSIFTVQANWDADYETCRTCRFWAASSAFTDMTEEGPQAPCLRLHTCFSPVHTFPDQCCTRYKEATFGHLDDPKARAHYAITEGDDGT